MNVFWQMTTNMMGTDKPEWAIKKVDLRAPNPPRFRKTLLDFVDGKAIAFTNYEMITLAGA